MGMIIIKVGGSLIEEPHGMSLACDIATLVQKGNQVLLVHGGGPQLDHAIRQESREPKKIAGRRVTSAEDLRLAVRIWRGDISTRWVRCLSLHGVSSLAFTGQDAQLIQAKRRPITKILTADSVETEVDFGFVGDIEKIDTRAVSALWKAGIVPVIAPLGASRDGTLLNINADTIAMSLSTALQADTLILMSNTAGLLRDHMDPNSRIPHITNVRAQELLDNGTIRNGMRPKVESILNALQRGVANVHLADGTKEGTLSRILLLNEELGTHFQQKACPTRETKRKGII